MTRNRSRAGHGSAAIAGAFIGTVVGAGFASGQETVQFFTAFGMRGLVGVALASALFAVAGDRMMRIGRAFGATSHRALMEHAFGRRLAPVADGLVTVFLLATAGAMASGAGATLAELYGAPRALGAGLIAVLGGATVWTGIYGVVAAIAVVAPLLIAAILGLGLFVLSSGGGLSQALAWPGAPELAPVGPWWAAAGLYVAYNMLLAAPVLGPLGKTARGGAALRRGGLLGGVGLGVGSAIIHLALAARMPEAAGFDVPMLYAAAPLPRWVPVVYSLLLLCEVYTTAVAMLFGFAARVDESGGVRFRRATAVGAAVAFLGGQFSFAAVVGTLYPVIGAVGILLLAGLARPLFHSAK